MIFHFRLKSKLAINQPCKISHAPDENSIRPNELIKQNRITPETASTSPVTTFVKSLAVKFCVVYLLQFLTGFIFYLHDNDKNPLSA
jgi:hypothetical protein